MRSAKEIIERFGELTTTDRRCIDAGFAAGNYSNGCETEDYTETEKQRDGRNGFWRMGFLLGFFSSYELHEVPPEYREQVGTYREVLALLEDEGETQS
jgi:hypothetical protein